MDSNNYIIFASNDEGTETFKGMSHIYIFDMNPHPVLKRKIIFPISFASKMGITLS